MKFYQLISLFLVFLFLSVIAYVFYFSPALSLQKSGAGIISNNPSASSQPSSIEKKPLCTDGQNLTCTLGSCDGIRTCKNGYLSECYLVKVCLPGTNKSCNENGCAVGHKVCNDCGTGYGECTE